MTGSPRTDLRILPPSVRSITGGKWHIARGKLGYGAWTFCGLSFAEQNYHSSLKTPAECKTCVKLAAARKYRDSHVISVSHTVSPIAPMAPLWGPDHPSYDEMGQ